MSQIHWLLNQLMYYRSIYEILPTEIFHLDFCIFSICILRKIRNNFSLTKRRISCLQKCLSARKTHQLWNKNQVSVFSSSFHFMHWDSFTSANALFCLIKISSTVELGIADSRVKIISNYVVKNLRKKHETF